MSRGTSSPPRTPDGRYIVVRGRLWRATNPHLSPEVQQEAVQGLMGARRDIRSARRRSDTAAEAKARAAVQRAKEILGERGPVWWTDGATDLNRRMARTTPYASWWETLTT